MFYQLHYDKELPENVPVSSENAVGIDAGREVHNAFKRHSTRETNKRCIVVRLEEEVEIEGQKSLKDLCRDRQVRAIIKTLLLARNYRSTNSSFLATCTTAMSAG